MMMTDADNAELNDYRARLVELFIEIIEGAPSFRTSSTVGGTMVLLLTHAYMAMLLADIDPIHERERERAIHLLDEFEQALEDEVSKI